MAIYKQYALLWNKRLGDYMNKNRREFDFQLQFWNMDSDTHT